jgi:parallel beta-helix repeat protein
MKCIGLRIGKGRPSARDGLLNLQAKKVTSNYLVGFMKHKWRLMLFLTILGLLTLMSVQGGQSDLETTETNLATSFGVQQLYPIEITSNSDFSKYASAGDGNATHPWVIEDYVIINATTNFGIYIIDTTDYFVIENCTIELPFESAKHAIHIDNAIHVNISNNRIKGYNGIHILSSDSIHIADNLINFSNYGIYVWGSDNCNISSTTGLDSGVGSGVGIRVATVDNFNLHNNTISGGWGGIECETGTNGVIRNNTARADNSGYGISVGDESSFVEVFNNTCTNHETGIYLWWSTNLTVNYNHAVNNSQKGIYLITCDNNTIVHNTVNNITVSDQRNAIYLEESNDNLLEWNTVTDNRGTSVSSTLYGNGIVLDYSHNNTLKNNTVFHSEGRGIYILHSDENIITQNTIKYSRQDGIFLWYADSNEITHNTINDNSQYGIRQPSGAPSIGNIVRWNTILNNEGGCLDIDTGTNTVNDNTCKAGIPGFLWIFALCGLLVVIWQVLLKSRRPQGCL